MIFLAAKATKSSTKAGTFTIGDAPTLLKLHGSLSRTILSSKTSHGSVLIVRGSGKVSKRRVKFTTPANRDASLSSRALSLSKESFMYLNISQAIILFRETNKIPQRDCAKALGISEIEYKILEESDQGWTDDILDKISVFFEYGKIDLIRDAEAFSEYASDMERIIERIGEIGNGTESHNKIALFSAIEVLRRHGHVNDFLSVFEGAIKAQNEPDAKSQIQTDAKTGK